MSVKFPSCVVRDCGKDTVIQYGSFKEHLGRYMVHRSTVRLVLHSLRVD